jgi:hypothetical protein
MGTNFFWLVSGATTLPTGEEMGWDYDDPRIHIGKRSAAGRYCWDCDQTLCSGGKERVHYGDPFLSKCPSCGKEEAPVDGLKTGPVAVELGFAQPETKRPTGVQGCSSFSWAQDPDRVRKVCGERPEEVLIVDEYDRRMTCAEFIEMLDSNCPLEYTGSIGVHFS